MSSHKSSKKDSGKDKPKEHSSKKDKTREHKSHKEHSSKKDKTKEKHRSHSTKHSSVSAVPVDPSSVITNDQPIVNNEVIYYETNENNNITIAEDEENSGFVFVYEANGQYFSKLADIDKADGRLVVIHPVYYTGYNNNMSSEEVTYSESQDKYISSSEDGSWLEIIYEYPNSVYEMEAEADEIIIHEDKLYHCDRCLLGYILNGEPDVIPLN